MDANKLNQKEFLRAISDTKKMALRETISETRIMGLEKLRIEYAIRNTIAKYEEALETGNVAHFTTEWSKQSYCSFCLKFMTKTDKCKMCPLNYFENDEIPGGNYGCVNHPTYDAISVHAIDNEELHLTPEYQKALEERIAFHKRLARKFEIHIR